MNGAQYENQQENIQQETPQTPYPEQVYGQAPRRNTARKSPALATILSCMPGLGQVYVGYYQQGFINIMVAAGSITALASEAFDGLKPFVGVCLAFFWLYNMIDANRRALHYNKVKAGLGGEEVPEGFTVPTGSGSLFGGVVLVVIGVLVIMDLNFGISMAWVKDWWPVLLIAFGGNLIYKARQKAE